MVTVTSSENRKLSDGKKKIPISWSDSTDSQRS